MEKYLLSYVYFIVFDNAENAKEFHKIHPLDSTKYCSGCAFTLESTIMEHDLKCLSSLATRDLNKLFKISNRIFPDFSQQSDQHPGTVYLVRSKRCLEISDIPQLCSDTKGLVGLYFSNTFFIQFKTRELAVSASKQLHQFKDHKFDSTKSPLEAHMLCSTSGFRNFNNVFMQNSQRKLLIDKIKAEKIKPGQEKLTLIVLGSALRFVTKSASKTYVNRLQKMLNCSRFVPGQLGPTSKKDSTDFSSYALAFYESEEELRTHLQVSYED